MKKQLASVLFVVIVVFSAFAQENTATEKRKGYISITLGVNVPVGAFGSKASDDAGMANTGAQFNLINFGYLFTENIGITATWFGAANLLDTDNLGVFLSTEMWSYGGLMAGPLFSFPVSETIEWDVFPMLGYAVTTDPLFLDTDASFAFDLGTTVRFNLTKLIALTVGADYFATRPEFAGAGYEQKITTFVLDGGIAFRLK